MRHAPTFKLAAAATQLAVLLFALFGLIHSAQSQALTGRPFKDMLGLGVKFSQGQPLNQLSTLEELGVTWVRDTVMWADMEPSPGQYNELPATFKYRLRYYKSKGIGVIFILAFGNGKAYPATPDNPKAPIDSKAFGRYAVQISKLLQEEGVKFVLEVWNEPHNFVIKPMLGGEWNGAPPSPWLVHYVDMVREVVEQVKAYSPAIKVIDCDDMWVLHYRFLDQGLPKALDGFGVHPYSGPSSTGPEMAAVYADTAWAKPYQLVDTDRSFASAVDRLRKHSLKKLGKPGEIWITEWGWAVGERSPWGPMTEDMVAAYLPRAFVTAAAAGVEVVCWFSAYDSVDGPMGLMNNKGIERPAYGAFVTMSAQLGPYTLSEHIVGKRHPVSGIQAFLFTKGKDQKVIIWNTDNKSAPFPIPSSWKIDRVTDLMGNTLNLKQAVASGSIQVGPAPIYITLAADSQAMATDNTH